MPDRGQYNDEFSFHFFGDDQYTAVTGWPDMIQTVTDDIWMGINQPTINVLNGIDFWRMKMV